MKVNVLGIEYDLKVCTEQEDSRLEQMDGLCDETTKEILAKAYMDYEDDPTSKRNLAVQTNKVKRHEIIHAFLFESGLAENSEWAQNEEMVDWFAIQAPKMFRLFEELDIL